MSAPMSLDPNKTLWQRIQSACEPHVGRAAADALATALLPVIATERHDARERLRDEISHRASALVPFLVLGEIGIVHSQNRSTADLTPLDLNEVIVPGDREPDRSILNSHDRSLSVAGPELESPDVPASTVEGAPDIALSGVGEDVGAASVPAPTSTKVPVLDPSKISFFNPDQKGLVQRLDRIIELLTPDDKSITFTSGGVVSDTGSDLGTAPAAHRSGCSEHPTADPTCGPCGTTVQRALQTEMRARYRERLEAWLSGASEEADRG